MSSRWVWLAALGLGLLGAYLLVVLLFEETVLGAGIRIRHLALLVAADFALALFAVRVATRSLGVSEARLEDVALGALVVLASLVGLDVAYSMYLNASGASEHDAAYELLEDAHILSREWIPQRYAPTSLAFQIHKPHYTNRALVYGDLYHAELLEVPEVGRALLSQRYIGNSVDAYGFRETTPLEEARIFALGDSFVFGVGVDQPKTWVEVLEREMGRPIYNLGVSGSGPRAHLLLLEYLLRAYPERVSIERLLWLIFDGNDLEDGHEVHRQRPGGQGLLHGTIVETLVYSFPRTLKAQSLLGRLVHGDISWRGAGVGAEHLRVDGVRLRAPLYRSEAFGPRLFFPAYVERAGMPESYVLDHAHRRPLEQTFEQMAALAKRHDFAVTVLTAASAARQYGPRFEGFPSVSKEPHFLDFVTQLAHRSGFSTIDLYRGMAPYASEELLFWRDDTHWNERGNQVVARIVAEKLRSDAGLSLGRK